MPHRQYQLSPKVKKDLFHQIIQRSDKAYRLLLIGSFGFGLALAPVYDTWLLALTLGSLNLLAYFGSKWLLPEKNLYQYVGAASMAIFMAQFIFQMHGLFEMHFFAFISTTFLITYSNWRLQIPLFVLIVIHHGLFAYLQFSGVEKVFFTQLAYMDLTTFTLHVFLAGAVIFICGLWAYHSEKKIIDDGLRAIYAEDSLQRNLALAEAIKRGQYKAIPNPDPHDHLSLALADLQCHLQVSRTKEEAERYISQGVAAISSLLTELRDAQMADLSRSLLTEVAKQIEAAQATFFLAKKTEAGQMYLQLMAGYAFRERKSATNQIAPGEGLIGQAALERMPIILRNLPDNYLTVGSSLGEAVPRHVVAWPLLVEQQLVGVMEFATFGEITDRQQSLLEKLSPRIASAIAMAAAQRETIELLTKSEALKAELLQSNGQLEGQATRLQASEANLQAQQKQLLEANQDLEQKQEELEEQNEAIRTAQEALTHKAEELELASKYKSEFLANMSHELRTPLNSILILANMLAENREKRLSDKEEEHASVIHKAGLDLLTLINDILDLSKIESGKLDINIEPVSRQEVQQDMELMFQHLAEEKEIDFQIHSSESLPDFFLSDRIRLEQILKNLLSNAIKFTPQNGKVRLEIDTEATIKAPGIPGLPASARHIAFRVTDTGIGIPPEKQAHIFGAFQQADGSTSRKYGGTGLGLSICVQISELLNGKIHLTSEVGKGSTFELVLPLQEAGPIAVAPQAVVRPVSASQPPLVSEAQAPVLSSDLSELNIFLVDDDMRNSFAIAALLESAGGTIEMAASGQEALDLLAATSNRPAILLMDLMMPGMDGLETIRHIRGQGVWGKSVPIIAMSAKGGRENRQEALDSGANEYVAKPIQESALLHLICQLTASSDLLSPTHESAT